MSDQPKCGKLVGSGSVQFACREDLLHDGPCACPEVGASQVTRHRWLMENRLVATTSSAIIEQSSGSDGDPGATAPKSPSDVLTRTYSDRLTEVLAQIKIAPGDSGSGLPQPVRSWMMGSVAQLSLVDLWNAWLESSSGGGRQLVLDKDQVERLVPPQLRIIK